MCIVYNFFFIYFRYNGNNKSSRGGDTWKNTVSWKAMEERGLVLDSKGKYCQEDETKLRYVTLNILFISMNIEYLYVYKVFYE